MSQADVEDRVVRRAVAGDAARLAELAERTFREAFGAANSPRDMDTFCAATYGAEIQAREIADPGLEIWLVTAGERLIAFLQLRWSPAPAGAGGTRALEIQRFYVDGGWHGRGVAQQLMEVAISRAGEGLADRIWLGVWELNPRAIAFYEKYDFAVVGEQTFTLGSDPQRDLVMARPVGR